eukprot:gene2751-1736_t
MLTYNLHGRQALSLANIITNKNQQIPVQITIDIHMVHVTIHKTNGPALSYTSCQQPTTTINNTNTATKHLSYKSNKPNLSKHFIHGTSRQSSIPSSSSNYQLIKLYHARHNITTPLNSNDNPKICEATLTQNLLLHKPHRRHISQNAMERMSRKQQFTTTLIQPIRIKQTTTLDNTKYELNTNIRKLHSNTPHINLLAQSTNCKTTQEHKNHSNTCTQTSNHLRTKFQQTMCEPNQNRTTQLNIHQSLLIGLNNITPETHRKLSGSAIRVNHNLSQNHYSTNQPNKTYLAMYKETTPHSAWQTHTPSKLLHPSQLQSKPKCIGTNNSLGVLQVNPVTKIAHKTGSLPPLTATHDTSLNKSHTWQRTPVHKTSTPVQPVATRLPNAHTPAENSIDQQVNLQLKLDAPTPPITKHKSQSKLTHQSNTHTNAIIPSPSRGSETHNLQVQLKSKSNLSLSSTNFARAVSHICRLIIKRHHHHLQQPKQTPPVDNSTQHSKLIQNIKRLPSKPETHVTSQVYYHTPPQQPNQKLGTCRPQGNSHTSLKPTKIPKKCKSRSRTLQKPQNTEIKVKFSTHSTSHKNTALKPHTRHSPILRNPKLTGNTTPTSPPKSQKMQIWTWPLQKPTKMPKLGSNSAPVLYAKHGAQPAHETQSHKHKKCDRVNPQDTYQQQINPENRQVTPITIKYAKPPKLKLGTNPMARAQKTKSLEINKYNPHRKTPHSHKTTNKSRHSLQSNNYNVHPAESQYPANQSMHRVSAPKNSSICQNIKLINIHRPNANIKDHATHSYPNTQFIHTPHKSPKITATNKAPTMYLLRSQLPKLKIQQLPTTTTTTSKQNINLNSIKPQHTQQSTSTKPINRLCIKIKSYINPSIMQPIRQGNRQNKQFTPQNTSNKPSHTTCLQLSTSNNVSI